MKPDTAPVPPPGGPALSPGRAPDVLVPDGPAQASGPAPGGPAQAPGRAPGGPTQAPGCAPHR